MPRASRSSEGFTITVKTHFNMSPADYEATRTGHLYERRLDLVGATLANRPSAVRSVLEIGCGTGKLLAQLAARHPAVEFDGVDVDERMIAYAKPSYSGTNLRFTHGDVTSLGLHRTFDLIYSIDVIHHLHRHLDEFRTVSSILQKQGAWLAIEPNIWHPYVSLQQERMKRAGYDENHFRPWAIEPLLREAGFMISSRVYLHLLPGGVTKVPGWLKRAERRLERSRHLGGSIAYILEPT